MTRFQAIIAYGLLLSCALLAVTEARADGELDFADPCKKAEKKFASTAEALKAKADGVIAAWDAKTEPPGEIRGLYVEAVRKGAYQAWESNEAVKPLIVNLKQGNPAFDPEKFFFESVYPTAMTAEKEAEYVRLLFKADYQANMRPKFLADRKSLDKAIEDQKAKLDGSCEPDVFNQVIRASFGRAILIVKGNFDAAKNESGEIAKLVRATSGVSLTDIEKYGIQGGPNSEFNKALQAAGIGPNSEISKGLKILTDGLNPGKWKVDLPKFDPPNIPAPSISVGGKRVCVPWC